MRRLGLHHVLALTLVAAIFVVVDQASYAAPASRPHLAQVTRRLASRLTVSLRRMIPAALRLIRRDDSGLARRTARAFPPRRVMGLHDAQATPFRFRLPPPVAA